MQGFKNNDPGKAWEVDTVVLIPYLFHIYERQDKLYS